MTNYLLELSIIHITLVLAYWVFLRKENQYAKMRYYLIGTTLLALVIPLVKLPPLFPASSEVISVTPLTVIPLDAMVLRTVPATAEVVLSDQWLIWIYLAISGFLLFKFISCMAKLIYLRYQSSPEQFGEVCIRRVSNIKGSFTFFNWIFLSDSIDQSRQEHQAILEHERAHASLGHSYDVVFFELFKVFYWWLPTTWFINQEIRKIHEYQSDAYVLKSYDSYQYSSMLISTTLKSNGLNLTSSFPDSLTVKRLNAMNQKAKKVNSWKFGLLSALSAVLFIVFACDEENLRLSDLGNQDEMFSAVEQLPEFQGGIEQFYKSLGRGIDYSSEARRKGIKGLVKVSFVVEEDGSITNVELVKGIGEIIDDRVITAIQNAPSFNPGKYKGQPVRVRMMLRLDYHLSEVILDDEGLLFGQLFLEHMESTNHGTLAVKAEYHDGEWSGTVYNKSGQPVSGALIKVSYSRDEVLSSVDGSFKIKTSWYKNLRISALGYESTTIEGRDLNIQSYLTL